MSFKLVRNRKNKNPYDLSALNWVCEYCGGKKRPASPYEMSGYVKYCRCGRNLRNRRKKL